jgi:hypothetical protein
VNTFSWAEESNNEIHQIIRLPKRHALSFVMMKPKNWKDIFFLVLSPHIYFRRHKKSRQEALQTPFIIY